MNYVRDKDSKVRLVQEEFDLVLIVREAINVGEESKRLIIVLRRL